MFCAKKLLCSSLKNVPFALEIVWLEILWLLIVSTFFAATVPWQAKFNHFYVGAKIAFQSTVLAIFKDLYSFNQLLHRLCSKSSWKLSHYGSKYVLIFQHNSGVSLLFSHFQINKLDGIFFLWMSNLQISIEFWLPVEFFELDARV